MKTSSLCRQLGSFWATTSEPGIKGAPTDPNFASGEATHRWEHEEEWPGVSGGEAMNQRGAEPRLGIHVSWPLPFCSEFVVGVCPINTWTHVNVVWWLVGLLAHEIKGFVSFLCQHQFVYKCIILSHILNWSKFSISFHQILYFIVQNVSGSIRQVFLLFWFWYMRFCPSFGY